MIGPPAHNWTVKVGEHFYGLVGDDTVSGAVTSVHYGFGHVRIPMHIYGFVGSVSVLLILLLLVYAFRRHRHEHTTA